MKNKFLIGGSGVAVVVLVLASFSPVVGYNSVKSSVKDSPLFNVRTKRAINEESETLTCNYLGKGQLIQFPTRDNKAILIQKATDRISSMNEREYGVFLKSLIYGMRRDNVIKDENVGDVIQAVQLLRINPNTIKNYDIDIYGNGETQIPLCTAEGQWIPGCWVFQILYLIAVLVLLLWLFISLQLGCVTAGEYTCYGPGC